MNAKLTRAAGLLLAVLGTGGDALAQSGGGYDLRWNTIDGGGATFSTGGGYTLGGTAGQPDAGDHVGGAYTHSGGFWYAPTASFTVVKDYNDDNPAPVTVALSCTPGVVSPPTALASEASPASFTVSGFVGTPVCTATEVVPANYTANQSGCANVALSAGTCTILNTLNLADLSVTLTDTPDPVTAGNNLTYVATLTNAGPNDALGASIDLPLPTPTTFVSAVASAGGICSTPAVGANGSVNCVWAGATLTGAINARSVTVVAAVPASTAAGTVLSAIATVTSTTSDPGPAPNTATATTTVDTSADLTVTLADLPDPVIAGTNLTYTGVLTNAGPSDAQDASLTLPLPAGTSLVSAIASAGGSCNLANPVVCNWPGATLPTATRTATIVVLVSPAQTANLSATITAGSLTSDPVANNTDTAITTVNTAADLSVTLTDTPDPVTAGTNLSYVATLTNNGPSDAQNANIALPLPATTTFVSATASVGANCTTPAVGTNGSVSCTWAGATASGAGNARSVTVVVGVPATTADGTVLSATATVASTTTDPGPAPNSASTTTTVNAAADLSVTLTDAPDPVTAGTNLTYTATLTNAGPSAASGVTVTLPLPSGTSLVSGNVSGGGACAGAPVVCTVTGNIPPGGSRVATIVVAVAPSVPTGSVLNATVTVAGSATDPNPGNNSASTTTTVTTSADLVVALTASATQAFVNTPVAFTATSLNLGPSDAQNVSITLTLTPDFRYSSHTASGASCTIPQVGTTGAIVCTWSGTTATGITRTLSVTAFSNVEGLIAVNASTASDSPDPVPANNLASLSVQIGYQVEEIPTLNSLGLILLSLLLGLCGYIAVRRKL